MSSKKGHKEPEEERKKNRSAEIKVGIALGNFLGVQRSPAMTGLRKLVVTL